MFLLFEGLFQASALIEEFYQFFLVGRKLFRFLLFPHVSIITLFYNIFSLWKQIVASCSLSLSMMSLMYILYPTILS